MKKFLLIFGVALAAGLPGHAWASEHYTFDKAHTSIKFAVSNLAIFDVTGAFLKYDGDFIFCPQDPQKDRIRVVLYSNAIHDTSGQSDDELQGPDFFNATRFPRITFVSTGVKPIDSDNIDITGNLTLLGVTRPVTLHVHYLGREADEDGDEDYVASFAATTTISRAAFGMTSMSDVVGDDVRLDIEAAGVESEK